MDNSNHGNNVHYMFQSRSKAIGICSDFPLSRVRTLAIGRASSDGRRVTA